MSLRLKGCSTEQKILIEIVFEIVIEIGTPCSTVQKIVIEIVIEIVIACSTAQKIVTKNIDFLVEDTC